MSAREVDVSSLPTAAFGSRDPLWWGVACLMAIEATVMAILWLSLLYVRQNYDVWPGAVPAPASKAWAGLETILLGLACLAARLLNRGTATASLRTMRAGLAGVAAAFSGSLAARCLLLASLGFRWDSHAYGSVVWLTLGMHALHVLTGIVESAVMLALLFIGPVEEKHLVDVRVGGLYTYYVAALWAPTLALIFFDPAVWRG